MKGIFVCLIAVIGLATAGKSEKLPEDPFADGSRRLVGDNFDEIVKDETKDVLIFFYAPWCGHCKRFKPTVQEFGKAINTNNEDVVVAELDATANDWDRATFPVKGYPTLYLAKKGEKSSPIKYDGARTFEGLASFL